MMDDWSPIAVETTAAAKEQQQQSLSLYRNSEMDSLLVSPRCESVNSNATSDSMTNITQMTISSYGFCSSRVTSDSTPSSEDNSISSFSESEGSHDQLTARLAVDFESSTPAAKLPTIEDDCEEFWNKNWTNLKPEQYLNNYNEFVAKQQLLNIEDMSSSIKSDSVLLLGEGSNRIHRRRTKIDRKKREKSLQRLVANMNVKNDLIEYSHQQHQQQPATNDHSNEDNDILNYKEQDDEEARLMLAMGLPARFGRKGHRAAKHRVDWTQQQDDEELSTAEKRKNTPMPAEIAAEKCLKKFWYNRFALFSKFDQGIQLDRGELDIFIYYYLTYLFCSIFFSLAQRAGSR